ncbi:MAG: polyketide synthase, partial [Acetobacteraceae bacterium]|nr:polyketide synthase [Acetobacteraceae bacterium]
MESFADRIAKLPHRKLALLATELYERSIAKSDAPEAIAVTAMACRFPGESDTPEAFWSLLERGGDAVGATPPERLAMTGTSADAMRGRGVNWGGFLQGVDAFDPALFGISAKEAESMDPQQRLLLEVCWEALENAGVPMDALPGETGVFMGISGVDYALLQYGTGRGGSSYLVTGVANAVAAGRISYAFGLGGPSTVVDTACSASASAIHLACQSLRARECEAALAGGVNLLLLPQATEMVAGLEGLASDGRCKAFSAEADGFVRSEGCGVLLLRRLSDATARGEPILGVIHGSAWNQDGKSGGLTAPNGVAQEKVIRAALENARLSPERISYIEAHGTGTALGDPIEMSALSRVFAAGRSPADPLLIGSVKTNIGHLEAAAGVAGVIKVLLALRHGTIPPHLHCNSFNPRIDWAKLPFRVTTEGAAWPRGSSPRIAGVSSFGFSGTNVHLLIGEAPAQADAEPAANASHTLLAISAKSRAALLALAARYADALRRNPAMNAASFAAAANGKRAHFAHRLALDIANVADAATELQL